MTVYINGVEQNVKTIPPSGKQKVNNIYYDPSIGEIQYEVQT